MPRQIINGFPLRLTAVDRLCFIYHGAEAANSTVTCRTNGGVNATRALTSQRASTSLRALSSGSNSAQAFSPMNG
jgi:hypothetical protein